MKTKIINIVTDYIRKNCSVEEINYEINYILNTDTEFYYIVDGSPYWIEGTPRIKKECLIFSKENALRILKDAKEDHHAN